MPIADKKKQATFALTKVAFATVVEFTRVTGEVSR